MPQSVEIEGHGIAEFPDNMTPDQIKGVIKEKFYSNPEALTASQQTPPAAEKPSSLRETLGKVISGAVNLGTEVLSEFSPGLSARVFGQTSASLRDEEKSQPLLSPENAKILVGELPAFAGGGTELGKGIAEGTANTLSGFSNPAALAQLPAFAVPGVAPVYAANILSEVPKQAEELGTIAGEHGMLSQEFGRAATEAAILDATGAAAGLHSVPRLSESLKSIIEKEVVPAERVTESKPVEAKVAEPETAAPRTAEEVISDVVSTPGRVTPEQVAELERVSASEPPSVETVLGRMTPAEQAIDFKKIEQPHAKGVEAGMQLDPSTAAEVAAELKETGKEMLQAYRDKEYDKATELQGKSTYLAGKLEGVKREGPNYEEVIRLQKEKEGTAPAVTEEIAQPELITPAEPVEAPPQRTFKQRPPADSFGSDSTPVAAAIANDIGGILSKSNAKKAGKLSGNEDLWNGAGGLKHPTHNKIYNENGQLPDQAAQVLYDQGLIKEPTPDAMYDALRKESQSARSQVATEQGQKAEIKTAQRQEKAFSKAAKDTSQPEVEVFDLGVGDAVTIGTEKFKVTDINPDTFDVTLEDGKKFGVQQVKGGDVIYGEHEPLEIARPAAPAAPAPEPALPKLRAGEKQGDLLANQTEDLALVGEKGVDYGKRAEEQAAAEIARKEAQVEQDRLQQTFDTMPESQVPSHLRPSDDLLNLLKSDEPVPLTAEQIKLQEPTEGGALFSRGGTRTKVKASGLTPKGDSEFIKIEPAWKRSVKGLERKGAADVIGETKNTVGKALADATKRHVDVEQELFGQLSTPLLKVVKGQSKSATEKAFGEVSKYLADKENGRPTSTLSSTAAKLVSEWENIAEKTGQIATANNVQVFDANKGPKGSYRPMHTMGRDFVPRMMKPEVERALRDPDRYPQLWNDLVDDFAKQRGISNNEAANVLRAEAGRFSSSDFMGNLEMARTGKMPESFYDYDLRSLAARYIPAFTERMSQIIAYGQRLGPRDAPLRQNLWDVARKESANSYTQEWLMNAEDQAVNLKGKGASAKGMARAQTIGSGLLLSSPTTTVMRNLLSGISATPELLGVGRSLKAFADTVRSRQVRMDAREIGAVRDNMGDFLHVDRLGESFVDDAIRSTVDAGLKYSGYNGSEVFVRSHGALTASQFAKDGIASIIKNPASMRSKEALALFKRMGADAEKIVAEGADWKTGPETRKFIRTVVRETQGGYRFDQVPLWANSNMGRFFYQFGRWGTQRARNIWNNGIKPALGEEVQWKGKTMNRRDVRPLLKMLGATVVLGETFGGIAQILFGRDRRDASLNEINAAWQDDDQKKAVALGLERVVNDVIMAGTLGVWSQPLDWAKGFKNQSRLKNPSEPPGLGSVRAMMELGQDALDQDGRVTRRDLVKFAASAAPGVKQVSDVARNVLDEPLYEAENDIRTLRGAGQRWARGSGVDIKPNAKGDFRKSALAPEYEPIKEALLVGDIDRASFLTSKFLDAQPNRDKALQNLKNSVKQSQPFRVGPYTSEQHRMDFMSWAEHNLSREDFNQAQRVQERYMRAAKDVNLW